MRISPIVDYVYRGVDYDAAVYEYLVRLTLYLLKHENSPFI